MLQPPTWGDVISVVVFLVTLHAYHVRNVQRFSKIEMRVNIMWSQLKRRLHIDDSDEEVNG